MELNSISDIEKNLTKILASEKRNWMTVGLLVKNVEEHWQDIDFWQGKRYKNITSWVKNLAVKNDINEGSIWLSLRAARALEKMYRIIKPNENISFEEIIKKYPKVSASSLEQLDKILSLKPSNIFMKRLVEETLVRNIGIKQLRGIYDEFYSSQMRGKKCGALSGFLHEMDLGKLVGIQDDGRNQKHKIITNLPDEVPLDALAIIPRVNEDPLFVGFTLENGKDCRGKIPKDTCDNIYHLSLEKEVAGLPVEVGHLVVDIENGTFEMLKNSELFTVSKSMKGKLGLSLINRMMLGRDTFLEFS